MTQSPGPEGLSHVGPQLIVIGAAAHAAKRLILYGNLVLVPKHVFVVSPSPLSVVAIAECAVAHGGVADEEEHGIVAAAGTASRNACCLRLVEAVEGEVNNMVDIGKRFGYLVLTH